MNKYKVLLSTWGTDWVIFECLVFSWLLPKTLDNALRDSGLRDELYKYFVLVIPEVDHNDRTTTTHRHHIDHIDEC